MFGGGGVILLNDIIITDLVPMRLRGAYFGIIGGVWALGSVSGPVIGGALAYRTNWVSFLGERSYVERGSGLIILVCLQCIVDGTNHGKFSQRWILWINIPFAVISLIMVPLFMKLKLVPGTILHKLKRVDWVGTIICVAAATSTLIPITWGGVQYAWDSWHTLVPLLVGLAGLAGFLVYEKRVASEPIIRLDLLKSYNMAYSLFAAMINALIVYGSLYFLPLCYEAVQGYNPIVSGVALFPATFTVAPVAVISGIVISKIGDFRVVTWIGWIAATLGLGVMCLLEVNTTVVQWIFLSLCAGIGLGLLYTSLAIMNQAASDDDGIAFAVTMFIFARSLGQCLGVAICGAIFQNQMKQHLLKIPSLSAQAVEYSRDATSLVQIIKLMPDSSDRKSDLLQSYADSLKIVWAVMCALSGVAMLGSFFVRKVGLDRVHHTEEGLQNGEEK